MSELNLSNEQIHYLLSPEAIRERAQAVYELTKKGEGYFKITEEKINECADFVLSVIYRNYPSLEIPFHSRWGHFNVGKTDRLGELNNLLEKMDPLEKARTKLDLVIVSVLLDAGAGMKWSYQTDGETFSKSEGLAVASYDMFKNGAFSLSHGLCTDALKLQQISEADIERGFQVSGSNPLVGVSGRVELLNNLGRVIEKNKKVFPHSRPGNIIDYLIESKGRSFEVKDILKVVLESFGEIWPSRLKSQGISLGDVWKYSLKNSGEDFDNLVCFHKLSQWLTYSLVDPIKEAGVEVTGAQKLTGLAEYRNGGLFVDSGVLTLKDESLRDKKHKPDSSLILEWRALTIVLLDKIGEIVREKLNKTPDDFPLAKVLEGGTWHAGREIAKKLREDGGPPLQLDSDGTVF